MGIKIYEIITLSVVLYGYETWSLHTKGRTQIEGSNQGLLGCDAM
jgi:hypothetical protein